VTADLRAVRSCSWCGQPLPPDAPGRRAYCGIPCRQDAGHYREALPRWQGRLAELEAAAAGYRGQVPTFIRNEIADLRRLIARGRP
jgi:hypothetical protein